MQWKKYREYENTVIDETRQFAKSNNIHFDSITAEMIMNAMRDVRTLYVNQSIK